jgi:hypothetical protein
VCCICIKFDLIAHMSNAIVQDICCAASLIYFLNCGCEGGLILVYGMHHHLIKWCWAHIGPLGIFHWCNGAFLASMLSRGYYGGPTASLDLRLKCVYDDFKAWCSRKKITPLDLTPGLLWCSVLLVCGVLFY